MLLVDNISLPMIKKPTKELFTNIICHRPNNRMKPYLGVIYLIKQTYKTI